MVQGYKGRAYTPPPSIAKSVTNSFLRFCQFALALTVAGLYGDDLHNACVKNVYIDAKWVFAEIVAALAAATSAAYLVIWCCVARLARPALTSYYSMHFPLFLWEMFMCLVWLTLFGIFGKMYLSEDPEGDSGIVRMKNAVWVDLVNLLLWTATMIWSGLRWWQGRIRQSSDGDFSEKTIKTKNRKKEFESNRDAGFGAGAGADTGAGAGAGPAAHDTPAVASGAAPLSMPDPTPFQTPRDSPRDAKFHDQGSHVVSRQHSRENAVVAE